VIAISDELLRRLLVFRDERNWKQFHTPKNLASALVVEASELLECFQWTRDTELERVMTDEREHIEDELADVAIVFAYLCHDLKVDVDAVVRRKVHKNAMKYPVELARGSSKKYDKL
jgi:NTP pyrophosphatase (non-canonical NTP hydrolase)